MSITSASVSSEKQMRPRAFTVSRWLEPLMKHEARAFDMTSQ